MKQISSRWLWAGIVLLWCFALSAAEPKKAAPKNIAQFTQGMQKHSGFFDLYWDRKKGKVFVVTGATLELLSRDPNATVTATLEELREHFEEVDEGSAE